MVDAGTSGCRDFPEFRRAVNRHCPDARSGDVWDGLLTTDRRVIGIAVDDAIS